MGIPHQDAPPLETVTITSKRYHELLADSRQLAGLHARGVDNWEGYSSDEPEDDDE